MFHTLILVVLGLVNILYARRQSLGSEESKDNAIWSRLKTVQSENEAASVFDIFDDDWKDYFGEPTEFDGKKFKQGPALSRFYYIIGLRYHEKTTLIAKAVSREYDIVGEGKSLMSLKEATETQVCISCGADKSDVDGTGQISIDRTVLLAKEQTSRVKEVGPLIGHAETKMYKIVEGKSSNSKTTEDSESDPVYFPNVVRAESRLYPVVVDKTKPRIGHALSPSYDIVAEGDPIDAKELSRDKQTTKKPVEEDLSHFGHVVSRTYEFVGAKDESQDIKLKKKLDRTSIYVDTSLRFKPKSKDQKSLKFLSSFINLVKEPKERKPKSHNSVLQKE